MYAHTYVASTYIHTMHIRMYVHTYCKYIKLTRKNCYIWLFTLVCSIIHRSKDSDCVTNHLYSVKYSYILAITEI